MSIYLIHQASWNMKDSIYYLNLRLNKSDDIQDPKLISGPAVSSS